MIGVNYPHNDPHFIASIGGRYSLWAWLHSVRVQLQDIASAWLYAIFYDVK